MMVQFQEFDGIRYDSLTKNEAVLTEGASRVLHTSQRFTTVAPNYTTNLMNERTSRDSAP